MAANPGKVREQFASTMLALGQKDENLVVMVGDISHGILQPFAQSCQGRYFNIGILEPTMVSMAAGMARTGLRVVIHTIAPFLVERSFEQIKLDFSYHRLPGNIVSVGSAFDYGNLGVTHHCYGDFALLKTIPRTEIYYPASPIEFDTLFRQSYANSLINYYRIPAKEHGVKFNQHDILSGKGIRITEGRDITLIATGPQLATALNTRDRLSVHGIDAEIIYIHTIRPLDTDIIRTSAKKTKKVIVLEEHMRSGGLGDDVIREIYNIPDLLFYSASIPDSFISGYGNYENHCESCGLTPDVIEAKALTWGRPN